MLKMVGACMSSCPPQPSDFGRPEPMRNDPANPADAGALSLIRTEISFGSRRLDQICEQIGHREKEPVRSLYTRCAQYLREMDVFPPSNVGNGQ